MKCENFRLQATKFDLPSGSLLILNTYFPCDPRTANFDDTELLKLLSDIQNTIINSNCGNIWLAGDLNAHFLRNNRFTNLVKDYLEELRLYLLWENIDQLESIQDIDYTHMFSANGILSFSTIDHFAYSRRLLTKLYEARVIHSGENTSNHSAIFARLNLGEFDEQLEQNKQVKRVNWEKSSEQARLEYQRKLSGLLLDIPTPDCANCRNIHCTAHTEDLENYTVNILEAVEAAAKDNLAVVGGGGSGGRKSTPGWTQFVKPYQEESKFWHSLWISANKPHDGPLLDAMRQSKNQYKYAIRRLKRAGDSIQNNKFVQSLLGGKASIFQEIKRFRGSGAGLSSRIDDEVGGKNIANHFAEIYSDLYNKVDLGDDFDQLCNQVNQEVGEHSLTQVDKINEDLLKQALKMMKGNKGDALFDIQSDCIINGPPELLTHLTILVKSFIMHGSVPFFILLCTILPLVKDNLGDITSSENYRAIASGSLLLKLLDIVILLLEGDKLVCDQLQFGSQPKSGTVMRS